MGEITFQAFVLIDICNRLFIPLFMNYVTIYILMCLVLISKFKPPLVVNPFFN